jgi:iron complex outermembrane receptor protein
VAKARCVLMALRRRKRALERSIAAASVLLPVAAAAQAPSSPEPEPVVTLPPVEVIATSPLAGVGIDRDKVPGTARTLDAADFERTASPYITETLFQRIPDISLSDPNGNSAVQELSYRGFVASPLQGTPQGLAVYMSGIRLNEAFGDTVNWDLIPTNAISRADVWTNNPVFGLNALGGAVSLQMKNGFTYDGFEGEMQGGSFGRRSGDVQYGVQHGEYSGYLAAQTVHDDGWRLKSPTNLVRLFGDLGWRREGTELHLITMAASTLVGASAATPIQLLERDDRAVYTTPQTTRNRAALVALNAKSSLTDIWSLQGNIYVRGFQQHHTDGNLADTERCSNSASPEFHDHLCLQDDGFPRPNPVTTAFRDQFAFLDANNNPIPCPSGSGNTCATTPYGTIDRTTTDATTTGASLQATNTGKLFDHGNHLVAGGSNNHSTVTFGADSTLGYVNPDLTVTINPDIPGNGSIIHTLGGLGYGPVSTGTHSNYYGLYTLDTFDLTDELFATAGARLNIASIAVRDRLGTSPDLNSNQTYTRLNPVSGLAYKVTSGLTAYLGYSEANRAPTPLELACSSRAKPCLLENFLVADPPLKQVVARTTEAGLRSKLPVFDGRFEGKLGLFRTDSTDDIINLASLIAGRGFFQNVPGTRRQGVEASLQYQSTRWLAYAGYSLIDATYRFAGDLPSPNNPLADANGNVHVVSGKRIPGIPLHQGKLGLEFMPTPQWKLGADAVAVGSRYFLGDDGNQNQKLPGYWLVNLHASYQVTKELQVFLLVNNVFDHRYALFGTYFNPEAAANVGLPITLTDRRSEVLGQPLSVYGGMRITF